MGKAEQKRREKIVEDKTFGLKNKNRSSKVQAYVQQVNQSVKQVHPQDRKAMAEQEARKAAKAEKKAREAEMALLFRDVDQGSKHVDPQPPAGEGEGEGEDFTYDPDAYLFRPEDFDEVEKDDRRLEEQLEEQREKLKERTDLTPVTEDSFQKWKTEKREEAAAKEAARLRQAKAGEGKLRGWDLWKMNETLFVDDEDADDVLEREEYDLGDEEEEDDYDLS